MYKEDKRLVADDYAGEIVGFIFNSKIDGKTGHVIKARKWSPKSKANSKILITKTMTIY